MGFAALRSALPILQQLDEAEPIDLSFSDADEVYSVANDYPYITNSQAAFSSYKS